VIPREGVESLFLIQLYDLLFTLPVIPREGVESQIMIDIQQNGILGDPERGS